MSFQGLLLFPFAVLLDAITSARNRLYDTGMKPSARFDVPVIGVGNLAVGGTGKTPMVEYLIRLLSAEWKVATLSRGYGRQTKGVRIAQSTDSPATIGDEPYQFFRKFGDGKAVVAVGEDRALAIPQILHEHEDTGVVVLDDAFQHRRVTPSFQILLTDYHNLFVNDYLLPSGRLRESKRGAARADAVVITKCPPHISDDEMIQIESQIRRYTDRRIFFSRICYGTLLAVTKGSPYKPEKVVLVSGIANAAPLEAYLRQNHEFVRHFRYSDHHVYTPNDLRRACEAASTSDAVVVTTEKDVVKMDIRVFEEASVGLYYLPIETEFLKNGKEFDELILNAVRSYAR